MNQRFDPNENRSANPAAWPADQASPRIDPVTGKAVNDPLVNDPLSNQRRAEDIAPRSSRSSWPILIILLAGLVLAMLVWLPAEMSTDNTATPPATTDQSVTPPADNATPPVDNSATPSTTTPQTNATPDTSTTPNATPATPDTQTQTPAQTPATGTDQQAPATGTAPQN